MKPNLIIIKCLITAVFIFFHCLNIHAQTKSAADTVAYIIKDRKSNEQVGKKLKDLGLYYLNIREMDNAILVADKFMEFSIENKYETGIYDAYALKGSVAMDSGDDIKAMAISSEWLKLATNNKSNYGMNGASFLLVKALYRQGNLDSAIVVSKKILQASHVPYDSVYFPKFNGTLGSIYLRLGDYRSSMEYYLKALHIAELTGNESLQSACIGNLAILNKELKNYREALKYHRKALVLRIKNNQLHDVAGTYNNMGTCYSAMEMMDSAIICQRQALALFTQLESDENIALVNSNLGQALIKVNQLDSGIHYLQMAKQKFSLINDTINMAYNSWMVGDAWMSAAKLRSDKSYLNKALKEMLDCKTYSEIKEMKELTMSCYQSLSLIYEEMGNESQALIYLKKYNLINDSVRSNTYTNQMAEMQTKYETGVKENEITKLNAEKEISTVKLARRQTLNYSLAAIAFLILTSAVLIYRNVQKKRDAEKQVAVLEKQNAIESMRSKIASDVHDDMGAGLTKMGLYSEQLLKSKVVPENEKQLLEKISLQSKEAIDGMREIIWASNPANDNLRSMLSFMRQYIDRFFDGTDIRPVINFPHDIGEVVLHPEVRRNLFLILKESLNNAVKYSGSDKVDIDFSNENENFNMNIKDYGKGLDDKSKNDFSNGLRNMEMRAQQIQSAFRLITEPGKGVHIVVAGKLY